MRHSVVGSGCLLTLLKLYSRISTWSSVGPLAVSADMVLARLQQKKRWVSESGLSLLTVPPSPLCVPTPHPHAAGCGARGTFPGAPGGGTTESVPSFPGPSPTSPRMERRKKMPPGCHSEGTVEEAPQELPPEIRS
ncbi:hypothetical protein NN561_020339 [Cricetulus griseus]